MQGQVCVVTGATSGIGKAAAAALARQGAEVIVVGRDQGRAEATAAAIQAGGAPPPKVEIADLARLDQVRALAGRLNQTLDRVDVLINNAGLVLNERQVTPDGYEHVFAVNHLAPFLLTNLLRPKLAASAPARVITVSSDAHTAARLDLDDPNLEHGWSSWRSYSNSKLANILFTRELAGRLDGTGVTANCLHPGVVRTGFGRDARPLMRAGITIARPFMLSPERGADTIVYLASSPDVAAKTGGYYVKRQLREPSAAARDDGLARGLWEISERLTGLAG
jgi:NAD(P)-dependent dehydrogenase (short-subunit alcohol dehydrogenase family)